MLQGVFSDTPIVPCPGDKARAVTCKLVQWLA